MAVIVNNCTMRKEITYKIIIESQPDFVICNIDHVNMYKGWVNS